MRTRAAPLAGRGALHAAARRVAEMREPPLGLDACRTAAARRRSRSCSARATRRSSSRASTPRAPALLAALDGTSRRSTRCSTSRRTACCARSGASSARCSSGGRRRSRRAVQPERRAGGGLRGARAAYLAAPAASRATPARPGDCPRRARTAPRTRWTPSRGATSASTTRSTASARIDEILRRRGAPADERAWALAYKRLREIDVPEMMAPIIYQTQGQAVGLLPRAGPPAVGRGAARDDGRGRLVAAGVVLRAIRSTWSASLSLNTEFTPLEPHIVLCYIEQGLMTRRPASATSGRSRGLAAIR